jgi:hypothetical protein
VPGGFNTVAHGINAAGQIVGSYSDAGGTYGFLLDHGSYTKLDVPGAAYTAKMLDTGFATRAYSSEPSVRGGKPA